MARPRDEVAALRRKEFVGFLALGKSPVEAVELSGHPVRRALETLSELGYVLSVLEPEKKAA